MKRQRIGLFGGTFDPVHLGHVAIASSAREAAGLDRVLMIPCRISPHKTNGPPPASGEDRLQMLRLAFMDHPWADMDDCELRRDGPSYSWETATSYQTSHPECRLFWIMGEDQWTALPKWRHPERLADLVEFLVFTRGARAPEPRSGYRARFLPSVHPASATKIRQDLSSGTHEAPSKWLCPEVLQWIVSQGLYHAKTAG